MVRLVLSVLLTFWWGQSLRAQSSKLETIGIEQGLSQGFVPAICQDREGYLWFGTNGGLNRYDGYGFKIFRHDPFDPYSLPSEEVTNIADGGSFLGVVTASELCLFDKRTERFYRVPGTRLLSSQTKGELAIDAGGTIWVSFYYNLRNNLYRIAVGPGALEALRSGAAAESVLALEPVPDLALLWPIRTSSDGQKLWLAGDGVLTLVDVKTGVRQRIPVSGGVNATQRFQIEADGPDAVWLLTADALWHYSMAAGWDRKIPVAAGLLLEHFDGKRFLWFRQQNDLLGYDLSGPLPAIEPEAAAFRLPIPEEIQAVTTDRYGIVWIGTNARGVRKFNLQQGVFRNYLAGLSVYCPPFVAGPEEVWLSHLRRPLTKGNQVLDLRTGQLRDYPLPQVRSRLNGINRIARDSAGDFWLVGTLPEPGGTLLRYRPSTGQAEEYALPRTCREEAPAILFSLPHHIWITDSKQLYHFNTATSEHEAFDYSHLVGNCRSVMAFARTGDGSLWIGLKEGLLRARPASGGGFTFTLLTNDPADRRSLPGNYIKSLLTDPVHPDVLWVGTAGQGLGRLDTRREEFTAHYTPANGLPDGVVYGIEPEFLTRNTYMLWVSTNKGLAKFNPVTGRFRYFFKSDGLQDNEFNTYASGRNPFSGELLFGGVNGLTIFDPGNLQDQTLKPEVRITGLRINGAEITPNDSSGLLTQSLSHTREIVLPYSMNNLVLQFASLDFTQPQRNQFHFYLKGAEREWTHRGFEHTAQYLHLPPGRYTFLVKGSNSDGVWNEAPTTLHIVVLPPWYASWWAYTLYALMLLGGGYFFYRFQLNRRLESAENDRLKELDAVKTRLYTNITHEFRTPLTVILGLAAQNSSGPREDASLPPEEVGRRFAIIRRNGENLLHLINQMLDLAKLESGAMRLHPVRANLMAFCQYLCESFQSLAEGRGIHLHFLAGTTRLDMDFDQEKLQNILHNLLSNALKFTPEGGHVYVQVSHLNRWQPLPPDWYESVPPRPPAEGPWALIRVADTGPGIPRADWPRIFDRFAQSESTARSGGTGIGLALVRELVQLMRGGLAVRNVAGKGAEFQVALAVRTEAPAAPAAPLVRADDGLRPGMASVPVGNASSAQPDAAAPLLLLVEDHPDVADYICECVGGSCHVTVAPNGREGIRLAFEQTPDLIISDVMMPGKDGYELTEALKNDERTSHIPIVLLTAKAGMDDRLTGLRTGADAYLTKPFHREELLATLAQLIENRRRIQLSWARRIFENAAVSPDAGAVTADLEDLFLQKLRRVVEEHIADPGLEMPQLERALGMSRSQIFRKVKALTGRSPSAFIRSIRLHRGRHLLKTTDQTVTEVAYDVGFSSLAYFSTAFLEEFGKNPSDLR